MYIILNKNISISPDIHIGYSHRDRTTPIRIPCPLRLPFTSDMT